MKIFTAMALCLLALVVAFVAGYHVGTLRASAKLAVEHGAPAIPAKGGPLLDENGIAWCRPVYKNAAGKFVPFGNGQQPQAPPPRPGPVAP